ncbi:MAG: DUF3592 domain-containing protein [Opitutaceae bacterium]|nr:DUF3592 domain-containing protein [Opitutaceae bacterium]
MTMILAAAGIASLVAGLLVMWCPAGAWAGLTLRRSYCANQASMAGALCFGGLGSGGAALLLFSGADLWHGWRSQNWHPVEAVVTASRLVEVRQIRSTNPAYRADVTYRYNVVGRTHAAQRIAFGAMATPDHAAVDAELATRFAPGATLTVRVDPDDPEEAVIDPGVQPKAGILGTLGAIFFAVSLWQMRGLWRDWEGDHLVPQESRRKRIKRA